MTMTNIMGTQVIPFENLSSPKQSRVNLEVIATQSYCNTLLSFTEISILIDELYRLLKKCFLKKWDGWLYIVNEVAVKDYYERIEEIFSKVWTNESIQRTINKNPYLRLMRSEIIFSQEDKDLNPHLI